MLNYPRGGDIITLDPAESYSVPTHECIIPVYEPLFRYDPTNNSRLIPCLALSWEASSDGLSYTYHLRQGVKFTDGTPFNASCVLYSYNRTIDLAKTQGFGPGWIISMINISKCSIIDTYTIKIVLDNTYYPFQYSVASMWGDLIVSPSVCKAHATPDDPWAHNWLKEHMVGTGPYMLAEYVPTDHVTLVKNPSYWGGWSGPHVDKIYMPLIAESATRRLRLEEGSLDIGGLDITDALAEEGKTGIVVETVPSLTNLMIFMNTQKPPLNNKLIRQALSYMYDYNGTIATVRLGLGTQARGPVPQAQWGADPNCPQYTYNLTKAAQLIQQAGYNPSDIKLDLWYIGTLEEERKCAEILQAGAAKLGVTINLHGTTWATLIDVLRPGSGNATKGVDLSVLYWWPDYADPICFLEVMYRCYNPDNLTSLDSYPFFNWGYYCNTTVNGILDEVVKTSDYNQRVQMYYQAERIIVEDAPALFLFDSMETLTYRSWVKGYYFNPVYTGTTDFYNIYIEGRPGT